MGRGPLDGVDRNGGKTELAGDRVLRAATSTLRPPGLSGLSGLSGGTVAHGGGRVVTAGTQPARASLIRGCSGIQAPSLSFGTAVDPGVDESYVPPPGRRRRRQCGAWPVRQSGQAHPESLSLGSWPLDRRCRPAAAPHAAGSQGRAIRQAGGGEQPMAPRQPDGLTLRTAQRQQRAVDSGMAVPELRSGARPRQQRHPQHPR